MSISFTCPQCGNHSEVSDSYAGQSGPCAHCGATVTVPLGSVSRTATRQSSGSAGKTAAIVLGVCLVLFLVCGGGLAALLIPAMSSARESARRMQCSSHLKQIGVALHNYHDTYGTLPAPYIADANGNPMHSWRMALLPFMDQRAIADAYDFDEPWNSPANSTLHSYQPEFYQCPSDGTSSCNYFMINVPDGMFEGGKWNQFRDVHDGTSNTLMIVEATGSNRHWMEPYDLGPTALQQPINSTANGTTISSVHPGGAMIVMGDASVHFLTNSTTMSVLQALATKSGDEKVSLP